jgi:hypothetical protein
MKNEKKVMSYEHYQRGNPVIEKLPFKEESIFPVIEPPLAVYCGESGHAGVSGNIGKSGGISVDYKTLDTLTYGTCGFIEKRVVQKDTSHPVLRKLISWFAPGYHLARNPGREKGRP